MKLKKENILVVDDDYDMLEVLGRNLKAFDFHVYRASAVVEAIDILRTTEIHLLITDLQMPGINGIELLKYVSEHFPTIPKLVITGFPSIEGAVDALKSGALDYMTKPFTKEELKKAVEKSLGSKPIPTQTPSEKSKTSSGNVYAGIVGSSTPIQNLIEVIERVKNNRATILISGESGTGKELVARAIHYKGAFAANPFIAVNCGAIPENLLESELFGYVKGAFTGALETRKGFFQAAAGGTIFLDEIASASHTVQTRLLRVLQEKEVQMVGSRTAEKISLRIIAATNLDLVEMVENNRFREDLYYRLNVVDIKTPALREHMEDLPEILDVFLKKYGLEYNKPNVSLSEQAMQVLSRHHWPGNVRELENVVQRAIILCKTQIGVAELPDYLKYPTPTEKSGLKPLKEVEKDHILKILASVGNNKTKAAEILQIDRKTLREKLK